MYAAFRKFMLQRDWARPGARIVVGVSGGMDSMVLLFLLRKLSRERELSLVVAHLNHTLRGKESDRDEAFVTSTCDAWGLPVITGRKNIRRQAALGGLSVQVAARQVRYAFFSEVLEKEKGDWLALGHHADDVAETVMMRLLRGASVQGLRGIPLQNEKVIRPLLHFPRSRIAAFAREEKIPYVEDSSNQSVKYLRNRIRHELIPLIERDYCPSFSRRLIRYATYFGEIQHFLSELTEKAENDVVGRDGKIDVRAFNGLNVAVRRAFLEAYLLKGGWVSRPLSFDQLDKAIRMAETRGGASRIAIGRGKWLVREYDTLFVTEVPVQEGITPVTCPIPGSVEIKEIGNRLTVREQFAPPGNLASDSQKAYVDGDQVGASVWIRGFRPGDKIVTNGTKKLKKLFIDAKIPRRLRRRIPLVGAGDDIIWVGGMRVNRPYYVTARTKRILCFQFQFPIRTRE